MRGRPVKIVVVGAGSAGCVVASRLSEDPAHEVLLIESGPDRRKADRPTGVRSLNWVRALGEEEAFHADVMASRQPGDARRQYMRGRGVGGSGAVNAMICLTGLPEDYDRWAQAWGCDGWSWADVEPWFTALRTAVAPTDPEFYTPVDIALQRAAPVRGLRSDVDTYGPGDGVGALYLSADASERLSTAEVWLEKARVLGRVTVLAEAKVDALLRSGDVCRGIRLIDGTHIEADHVILCAGAFESPAILLRSNTPNPAVGLNLRDHPAASINLKIRGQYREANMDKPCINVVMRASSTIAHGDLHLLPLHGSLDGGVSDGVVMAALMTVRSEGDVTLDPSNPSGPPVIDMRMLTDPQDRRAMHEGIDLMIDVLESPSFADILDGVIVDSQGTSLTELRDHSVKDRYLQERMGDYFHACGTCRMGDSSNSAAVVDLVGAVHGWSGVHVMDASVMPDVPAANTHWPTVVLAERLVAEFMGRSIDDLQPFPVVRH